MKKIIKSLLTILPLSLVCFAGENKEVKVPETKECCDCQCEWNEQRDGYLYPFKSKEFLKHYRYFGGKHHICIDRDRQFLTMKDEKGGIVEFHYHFKDESVIHFCNGVWCPKECCFDMEEFWNKRIEETDYLIHGNHPIKFPVIPAPAPTTRDN